MEGGEDTHCSSVPALACLALQTNFLMADFKQPCSGSSFLALRSVVITHWYFCKITKK